jgi:hypothetical protein
MQLTCPHCSRILEITGEPPSFCAYCGHSLSGKNAIATVDFDHEGTTLPPTDTAPLEVKTPDVIGGYRLLGQIGSGGMGTVHEAEEITSGRRVAVKIISRNYSTSSQTVERFRQEGRLASLITHPRCVFVLAADEEKGQPYIVMELMTGQTLQELVDRKGPLPVEDAITKILDVIEGLEEAHRNGVIHRDVKPSNCFLEPDDHVKIGDFGLSKSLVQAAHLTRTGAFLGTPLYASPEQVRAETVDEQTDVYSVAATLYFLLTGRAPHQTGDAAATLARIAADDAPSLRALQPGISEELDAVVLRGLERQCEDRWPNLAEFREALRTFLPGQLSIGGMGMRFGAYAIDMLGLQIVQGILAWALSHLLRTPAQQIWSVLLMAGLLKVVYFGVCEGIWGWSAGKLLVRLRVRRPTGNQRPGLMRSFTRVVVLYLWLNWGTLLSVAILAPFNPVSGSDYARLSRLFHEHFFVWLQATFLPWLGYLVGVLVLFAPARARNGYRGLHEFLSGTRVVGLPLPRRHGLRHVRFAAPPLLEPPTLPASVANYQIAGALIWNEREQLLAGQDPSLGRKVWIWLRARDAEPLSEIRRRTTRLARLRCLASGVEVEQRWDAFVAPAGTSLRDLVEAAGRLSWPDVRPILEELTDELIVSVKEGTLPATLATDQVWIEPNGRVQLLDMRGLSVSSVTERKSDPGSALDLLRAVAVLTLEGRERRPDEKRGSICAPLPGHAADMLQWLLSAPDSLASLEQFQRDLRAARDLPGELTRSRRTAHLAALGALVSIGLAQMFIAGFAPGFMACMSSFALMHLRSHVIGELATTDAIEVAAALANPLPFDLDRTRIIRELDQDAVHIEGLRQNAAEDHRRHEIHLQALGAAMRNQQLVMEQAAEEQYGRRNMRIDADLRELAKDLAEPDHSQLAERGVQRFATVLTTILTVSWPATWVVLAFLTRGGLNLRMMRIRLVGWNGKPAARWRCAWRTLLIWTPLTGMLVLSVLLETTYWLGWVEQDSEPWMLWASSVCWWVALALLVSYGVRTLWFPVRGLHDRLSGTYLVPA